MELLSFHFSHAFPLALREERIVGVFYLGFFIGDILSALLLSLSVLYTVYFVVRCCDLCGVLMYLFILFQLFRIYNETKLKKTNHKTIFSVFLFPSLRQTICNN